MSEPSDPAPAPAVYGTATPDEPVGRSDFERAVRALNLSDVALRDAVLNLAAAQPGGRAGPPPRPGAPAGWTARSRRPPRRTRRRRRRPPPSRPRSPPR